MYVEYTLFFRYAYFEDGRDKCFTIRNLYDNFVNTGESEGGMVYMEKKRLTSILQKIYRLLDFKQKFKFLMILVIMVTSAALTQITPKTIGWLTDDILSVNGVSFK